MFRFRAAICYFILSTFGACAVAPVDTPVIEAVEAIEASDERDAAQVDPVEVIELSSQDDAVSREAETRIGSGEFLNEVPERSNGASVGQFDVFLEDVSLSDATDAIIGEILGESYLIDNQVTGQITLKSNRSLDREGVLALFRSALEAVGAELSYDGTLFRIVPTGSGTQTPRQIRRADQSGSLSIVELEHAAAIEMARIIEPLSAGGTIARVDPARNVLFLDGSDAEVRAMEDLIAVFDKDWMAGMSVSILPVENAEPSEVVSELEAVFGTQTGGPAEGLVQFIPNERLSSILAISANPELLERAQEWIGTLAGSETQADNSLEIYEVQNRVAADLAAVLQAVGLGEGTGQVGNNNNLAPGSNPTTVTTDGGVPSSASGSNFPGSNIVVDEDNNALIIMGNTARRQSLIRLARELDVLPHQILLEATIAEVTLGDELQFGVQWFFEEGDGQAILSDVATGAVTSQFPGFSFLLEGTDGTVVLNALSAVTDVKIISSPAIMVLNNHTATLQVGDEVPVTTQSAQSVIDQNAAIVNSITFRDTGILLTVTPRVNEEGRVLLEILQEVSDVVATTTSGIDSPTIQQRRIDTTVIVGDNQSLLLGGLIQDGLEDEIRGVPVLSQIPILGNLFRSRGEALDRTELMILITPRVVRNDDEARQVTDEYRDRVRDAQSLLDRLQ